MAEAGGRDPDERGSGRRGALARRAAVWAVLLAIPIIGFTILGEDYFNPWIEAAGDSRLAAAVACFSLLAVDVLLPVPSSVVAVVSGERLGFAGGAALNWTAITLGHWIGFAMARRWGAGIAGRFIGESGLARAERASNLGATAGLILTRPIPIIAEAMSMHAGLTRYPAGRYLVVVALANIPHSVLYAWAGSRAGTGDAAALGVLVWAGVGIPTAGYLAFAVWRGRRGQS